MKAGEELKRDYLAGMERESNKLPPTTGTMTFTREGMWMLEQKLDLLLSAHFAREAEKPSA